MAHRSLDGFLLAATPALVGLNWRRGHPAHPPLVIAGLLSSASGVGEAARLFAAAAEATGTPVVRLDVGPALGLAPAGRESGEPIGAGGLLVSFLNPPELLRWLPRGGAPALRGRRHVGYWFWELPKAPPTWRPALRFVDEVWCQSRFTETAIRAIAPPATPIRVLPHPVFMYPETPPDRARWDLPAGCCVVLSLFDLRSTSARKNPLGAIEAFTRAVGAGDPARARLVCKMRGEDAEPETAAKIEALVAGRKDITLVRGDLSAADVRSLVASADVALSLHRAEGFGLLAAEAMWMGKPVVTTGWSGVLDFSDGASAELVGYRLAPVRDQQNVYQGGDWAEPDLEDAADRLRRLIEDEPARRELGARAREKARRVFLPARWGDALASALGGKDPEGSRGRSG